MQIDLSFNSGIEFAEGETDTGEMPLMVSGMSCKAGYIKKKQFIIPHRETTNIVRTLKTGIDGLGAYLLKDHGGGGFFGGKSVDSLVGRVEGSHAKNGVVYYKARLEDEDLADKVRKKLVTSSSVGLRVNKMECSICGREYGHPECFHFIGQEYPDEKLTDLAAPYLEEMGGVPIAAIVGKDIEAREQSIVLFPAIEGASVGLNFSEDAQNFFDETEEKKKGVADEDVEETVTLSIELYQKVLDLLKSNETFIKQIDHIDVDKTMTEDFDFETLMGEIADLKQSNVDLADELKVIKDDKSEGVTTLTQNVTDLSSELETAKAIIQKFSDAEDARKASELEAKVNDIKEMREALELPEKEYEGVSEEVLDSEMTLLKSFTKKEVKGLAADDVEPVTDEAKYIEAKEDVRELIFGRRTDDKKIKGIRHSNQLVN